MPATISATLQWAAQQLQAASETAYLDAEVLLTHVLQVSRSYCHAWPERRLTDKEQQAFIQCIGRRATGEPIAYITGHREFWSLDLVVTPDVLIPRPETELLVELVLEKLGSGLQVIADLGTGSGAIALALAHERPAWEIFATDRMPAALNVARHNAMRLQLTNVVCCEGLWCEALPDKAFDAIVSNPPYIAIDDAGLAQPVRQFEPSSALFSGQDGLQEFRQMIAGSKKTLKSGGYIFLEHGYQQAADVRQLLAQWGYDKIAGYLDLAGLDRVTIGRNGQKSL